MSEEINAIVYTDAGYDAFGAKKVSGYGVHGYTFINALPKKGTGNSKVIPTDQGYEGPLDDKGAKITGDKVTVTGYFDIIGGGLDQASSGEAELNAFILALDYLKDHPEIKSAIIYCDARFVTQGVNDHLDRWSKKGWKRADGTPIKYQPTWEKCHSLLSVVKENTQIDLRWIKGHNGNVGNEVSDKLATKGKVGVYNDPELKPLCMSRDTSGYWNPNVDVPRLLQAPRWYFDTTQRNWIDSEGNFVYYVGAHGTKDKEPELLGKPYSDNYLGVVHCAKGNEALDALRRLSFMSPTASSGRIVVANLDRILNKNGYAELIENGLTYHLSSKKQIFIRDAMKAEILSEMTPIGQGYRMKEIWRSLDKRLMEIRSGHNGYQLTDITDQLYEPHGKKGLLRLRPEWTQKVKVISVKANFNLELEQDDPKPFVKKIRLIMGEDILTRNQLSAIAEVVKSVHVASWRDSDQVGRYGVYIETTEGDFGLWTRYESNLILVEPSSP